MAKILAIEWLGLGESLRESGQGFAYPCVLNFPVRGGNKPPTEREWGCSTVAPELPENDVWWDVWTETGKKIGTFAVGGNLFGQSRCISLEGAGWSLWASGDMLVDAIAHPYHPRLSLDRPHLLMEAASGFADRDVWDITLYNWTDEITQDVSVRGGLSSSGGLTTVHTYGGRNRRDESGITAMAEQGGRDLENLVGQDKLPWGADQEDPLSLRRKGGVAHRFEREIESSPFSDLPRFQFQRSPNLQIPVESNVIVYAGSESTVGLVTDDVQNDRFVAEVLAGLFGSPDYPLADVNAQAQFYTRPPTLNGRRGRLWILDDEENNPWLNAELVQSGIVERWNISGDQTNLSIQWVNYIQWIKRQRGAEDVVPQVSYGAAVNREVESFTIARDVSWMFRDPLNIETNLSFYESINDNEPGDRIRTQWAEMGGYAFPSSAMLGFGVAGADTRILNVDIADSFVLVRTFASEDVDAMLGDPSEPLRPPTSPTYDATQDIEDDEFKFEAIKFGILIGERDEGFEIDDEVVTLSERQFSPFGLLNSGATPFLAEDADDPNWEFDFHRAAGWNQIPTNYNQSTVSAGVLGDDSNVFLDLARSGAGFLNTNIVALNVRYATKQCSMFGLETLPDAWEDSEPCHVFRSIPADQGVLDDQITINRTNAARISWKSLLERTRDPSDGTGQGEDIHAQASTMMSCSIAEIIVQVLCSTGTYGWGFAWDVMPGRNGPYDVLPQWAGLGIPIQQIDVEQILNFGVWDDTGERLVKLSEVFLHNKVLRYEDADDIEAWLQDQLLEPYGLAIVSSRDGYLQLVSMDGFTSYDVLPVDPHPEDRSPLPTATDLDLHVDNPSDVPEIQVEQRDEDIISVYSINYPHDSFAPHYDEWGRSRAFSEPLFRWLIPSRRYSARRQFTDEVDKLGAFGNSQLADQEVGWEIQGVPPYSFGTFRPRPGRQERLLATNGELNTLLYQAASRAEATRISKLERWSVGRPELTLEIVPYYPAENSESAADAVQPGRLLFVSMSNVTGVDGGRGAEGFILVTSVSRNVTNGRLRVIGRLISTGVPIPGDYGNYWALAAYVKGVDGFTVTIDGAQGGENNFRGLATQNELLATQPMKALAVDEFGRPIEEFVIETITASGPDLSFEGSGSPGSWTYVILKPDQGDVGPESSEVTPHSRGNAHYSRNYNYEN